MPSRQGQESLQRNLRATPACSAKAEGEGWKLSVGFSDNVCHKRDVYKEASQEFIGGAGEMAGQLRALVLTGHLGPVPVPTEWLTTISNPVLISAGTPHAHGIHTFIQVKRSHVFFKKKT